MDIMDMTVRQLLAWVPAHPVKFLGLVLIADNILATACMDAGWTKAGTGLKQISAFIRSILIQLGVGIKSSLTKKAQATWEFLLLICVCIVCIGCALRYHETTFIQGYNIESIQYGHMDNATINHEGNLYIGVEDGTDIRSSDNPSK